MQLIGLTTKQCQNCGLVVVVNIIGGDSVVDGLVVEPV